jgi:hypothetical protein
MNNYKFVVMKRGLIFIILMSLLPFPRISAQNPNLEKLNTYKIAFFTKRLNLTSQEAEKFWPVYNEFQNKRNQIQLERQALNKNINQNELNMSEKEMIDAGDKVISLQVQEASLAQEYHKKFREILSPVKVVKLYQAENQYRQLLLNELQNNRPALRTNPPQVRNNRPLIPNNPSQGPGRNSL